MSFNFTSHFRRSLIAVGIVITCAFDPYLCCQDASNDLDVLVDDKSQIWDGFLRRLCAVAPRGMPCVAVVWFTHDMIAYNYVDIGFTLC